MLITCGAHARKLDIFRVIKRGRGLGARYFLNFIVKLCFYITAFAALRHPSSTYGQETETERFQCRLGLFYR